MKLCVAASNEWPGPETARELAALFDRFTFRKAVSPVRSADGRRRLLWTRDHMIRSLLEGPHMDCELPIHGWSDNKQYELAEAAPDLARQLLEALQTIERLTATSPRDSAQRRPARLSVRQF